MDTNQQRQEYKEVNQDYKQSLLDQWQSQQQSLDQQRMLQLQNQGSNLMQTSEAAFEGAQLDGGRFNPAQQPNQYQQSLQQLQQMQQMHGLTEQDLQMSQHQQMTVAEQQQQEQQLNHVRAQLSQEPDRQNQLGQQFSELDQFHFMQQNQQSQQVLDQEHITPEELQEQLRAALEALRQQYAAGALSEQEYQEQAFAIAQGLGVDLIAEGNGDQLEQVAQQMGHNVDVPGMDMHQQQESQQMWLDEQQRVQGLTMRLLESNPQITEEELYQAIQQHLLEQNPNLSGVQEALDGGLPDQVPQPAYVDEKNLEELALQYNVDREQLQQALHGIQQGELERPLHFGQQDFMQFQGQEPGPGAEAIPQNPSDQQSRAEEELGSIDTEQQKAYEKKRDQNFARELRLFYKKLLDKLGRDAVEKISKQSEEICRQIDEAQRAFIGRKREMKGQDKQRRGQEDKKQDGNHSDGGQEPGRAADGSSSSSIPSVVGADADADSAFHSELYGPNSNIDPDGFIQNVLVQLQGHDDLAKQFKRFLPDDDEDDKKSIERKYWQFRDQLQMLEAQNEKEINNQNLTQEQQQILQEQSQNILADMDAIDCSGLLRNGNGEVDSVFISQLKNDAFQMLFDLLKKYQTAKDTRCVQDALTMYGQKIMCVAEKYQKFLQIELSQRSEQQINAGAIESEVDQQALIKYQVEHLGMNMKLMLSLIPQEVVDNYTVMSPSAQQVDADSPDQGSPKQQQNQGHAKRDNKLLLCLEENKGKAADGLKNQQNNVLKYQKPQNDRQSRLQRRQEAKESKEKAAKTAKPVAPAKQPPAAAKKSKQRGGRNKKTEEAPAEEDPKQQRRSNSAGVAAKDDDETEEEPDEVDKSYTEEEAQEEAEEEGEEEEEMEEEEESNEEDNGAEKQASSSGNVGEQIKQGDEREGKNMGSDGDGYHSDRMDESNSDGLKMDEQGNILPNQQQAYNRHGEPKVGRMFQDHRMKSIAVELQQRFPINFVDLAKPEIQLFVNLQKQLRSEEDWHTFIKLFCLYMEGVVGLKDFFALFDERFGSKIKGDLKKEIQDLIPTRGSQRRLQSDILKPWNDLENQKFEKIPDSSYYKIGKEFHLPICTAKLDPKNKRHYQDVLNERYLSLSMGSENFKCKIRNGNEDLIFKNEDEMYKLDTQIEMFRKCQDVVEQEIENYDQLSVKEKAKYEFPRSKFRPLMHYWEKRYKDALIPFLMCKAFHRDLLIQLRDGLGGKLQELQNQKFDQLAQFEEIFKKHFIKSLDHRNIQYKEFIKKFLNKQDQMKEIKLIAQQNQCSVTRTWNQLKGGNCRGSAFYHSFGNFVKHDLQKFDPDENMSDYPIDMKFVDKLAGLSVAPEAEQDSFVRNLSSTLTEKMPHSRMIFKDKTARNIAIKILCLYIKFSQQLHANDRPRMTENLKQIIQNFLQVKEFSELYEQCCSSKPRCGIESLTAPQIDLMMSQDSHLYYVRRCERLLKSKDGLDNQQPEHCPETKPEVPKPDEASQQDSSLDENPEPEHMFTERVLRDKGDGNRQKNKQGGPDYSQGNRLRNNVDDALHYKKQMNSNDRKAAPAPQFQNIEPIKIQIQKTLEEIREECKEVQLQVERLAATQLEQMHSQTADLKVDPAKSQSSPVKGSNAMSASEDERRSVASDHTNQENPMSQLEKKSAKQAPKNDDAGDGPILQEKDKDMEDKDDTSLRKSPTSPEKQGSGFRRYPQKYEKMRIEHDQCEVDQDACFNSLWKDAEEAMFLPFYKQRADAEESYSLFYAPPNVFIFLKLFYSLYERVLYAQTLVKEKIQQDLAEMSVQDKLKYGITLEDMPNGAPNPAVVHDIFFKERYEHLLKGIFATTTQFSAAGQSSAFQGIGYSHSHHLMDHNKYEDFGRQLLGKNAFLLFQIDKIIFQAVKQLQLMHTDHAYQKAKDLYKCLFRPQATEIQARYPDVDQRLDDSQLNDRLYLAHYAEQIVDQFSLKDCQNQAMGRLQESWLKAECKHTLSKFTKHAHGLLHEGCSRTEKESSAGGVSSASASANSNFQAFRFLWSSKSQILTVHYIQLNPYMLPTQSTNSKHFKRIMQENFDLLQESTVQPTPPVAGKHCTVLEEAEATQACSHCVDSYNQISVRNEPWPTAAETGKPDYSKRLHPPIFLKRNMKLMRKIRESAGGSTTTDSPLQVNGLVQRIVPHLNQLTFDKEGEDVYIVRRKTSLKVSECNKMQLRKQLRANQIRTKKFKQSNESDGTNNKRDGAF